MSKLLFPLLGLLFILCLHSALSQTFVATNTTCSPSCDGSEANPWPTLEQGLNAVYSIGGTIVMKPGIYEGRGNFNLQITNSSAISIRYEPFRKYPAPKRVPSPQDSDSLGLPPITPQTLSLSVLIRARVL